MGIKWISRDDQTFATRDNQVSGGYSKRADGTYTIDGSDTYPTEAAVREQVQREM